ncbi:MAG: cytochrome c3 family protein [Bacteroidetes bacterium]|nr:cytochrome c3 family protein [Bacteroidota bacterium]
MMRCFNLALLFLILFSGSVAAQKLVGKSVRPHLVLEQPCEECHDSDSWQDIHFDHRKTQFPLTGLHLGVSCRQCHTLTDFSLGGKSCSDCHEDIHRRQLGDQCQSCHTETGWQNVRAGKAHSRNRFPLLGQHQNMDCLACHQAGMNGRNFIQPSAACFSCHSQDYTKSSLDHRAAGFGITCESCHDTQTWMKGRFDHPASFAIYLGEHFGRWESCQTCHPVRNNFKINYCGKCHDFSTFSDAHGD